MQDIPENMVKYIDDVRDILPGDAEIYSNAKDEVSIVINGNDASLEVIIYIADIMTIRTFRSSELSVSPDIPYNKDDLRGVLSAFLIYINAEKLYDEYIAMLANVKKLK